jgi:hypothetical protein
MIDLEDAIPTLIFINIILLAFKMHEIIFKVRHVLLKKFLEKSIKLKDFKQEFFADYCYILQFRNGDRFTAGNEIMRVELLQEAISDAFIDKSLFDTNLKSMRVNRFIDVFLKLEKEKFLIIDATDKVSENFQSKKALVDRNMHIGYYHAIYDQYGDMKAVLCYEYSYTKMPVPQAPYPIKVSEAIKTIKYLIMK